MNNQNGGGKAGGSVLTLRGYYTAKNINATSGSRSPINDNLAVGDFLIEDPYAHDKGTSVLHLTQPQTNFMAGKKYVVTSIGNGDVNTIPDSGAATQRKGGFITVAESGHCNASVGACTAGNRVIVTNGSFDGSASTGTDVTVAVAFEFVGVARATQTATGIIGVTLKH